MGKNKEEKAVRGRPKDEKKYSKNPFKQQVIEHTITGTRMIYSSPTQSETFAAVNRVTGEDIGDLSFGKRIKTDKTQFLKLYAEGVKMFLGLKSPGIKMFMLIYDILMNNNNYQADSVDLVYSMQDENVQKNIGKTTFHKGIKELKDVGFLAPTLQEGKFWINADYVFRGDRLTLVNEYILDVNSEKTEKKEEVKQIAEHSNEAS